MADDSDDFSAMFAYTPPDGAVVDKSQSTTLGDVGKSAAASALGMAAQPASALQYAGASADNEPLSTFGRGISDALHSASEYAEDSITPGGKRAANAKFMPDKGDSSVFDSPWGSFFMKTASAAPLIGAMSMFPEGTVAAAATGAGMQIGQNLDAAIHATNEMSDADLKEKSPVYAKLRMDYDQDTARMKLAAQQEDAKGVLTSGLVGAVGMGAGARVLQGAGLAAGEGLAGRVIGGAAENAIGMGAMGADTDLALQHSMNATQGIPDNYDYDRTAKAAINYGMEGAVFGAGAGMLHSPAKADAPPPKPKSHAEEGISGTGRGSEQNYAKAPAETPEDKGKPTQASATVATVGDLSPDATQTEALTPGGNSHSAEAVKAAAERVEAAQTAPEPPAPTPPAPAPEPAQTPSQPAPTPIAEATKRVEASPAVTPPEASPPTPAPVEKTVPEAPATLEVQQKEVLEGKRPAILYPKGTPVPTLPEGLKPFPTKQGTIHFDPKQITWAKLMEAYRAGRLNDVLGLGSVTKDEAMARTAAGETPVAVTERTADGVETKAAAGTTETAPDQKAELEDMAQPGHTVQIETPEAVISKREAANEDPATKPEAPKPRILEDVTSKGKGFAPAQGQVGIKEKIKADAKKEAEKRVGGHKSKDERQARADLNASAEKITAQFPPIDGEENYANGTSQIGREARASIRYRAEQMVTAADAAGVKLPAKIARNMDSANTHGPHTILLQEARALVRKGANADRENYERFVKREVDLRAGNKDEVIAERIAEGEANRPKPTVEDGQDTATVQSDAKIAAEHIADTGAEAHAEEAPEGASNEDDLSDKAENERASKSIADAEAAQKARAAIQAKLPTEGAADVQKKNLEAEREKAKQEYAKEHGLTVSDTPASEAKAPVVVKSGRGKVEEIKAKAEAAKKAVQDALKAKATPKAKAAISVGGSRELSEEASQAKTGEPITVHAFHGTTAIFDKFKNIFKGSNYLSDLGAHWFTASSEAANSYAIRLEQSQFDKDAGKTPEPKGTPNVHMVTLDLKNPRVVDMEGKRYDPLIWNKELNAARKAGHDGVIMKNAVDGAGVETTVYSVFDESSIRGRFDELKAKVEKARENTNTDPTPAQKESGDYKKGTLTLGKGKTEVKIAIEIPKGETRSGVDPDGKPWETKMPGDYGEFKGTKGADGDPVDVIVGPKVETDKAFVVNQVDPKTGEFDEHKVVVGTDTQAQAEKLYDKGFSDGSGPDRRADTIELNQDELAGWLEKHDHDQPASDLPPEVKTVEGNGGQIAPVLYTKSFADVYKDINTKREGAKGVFLPLIAKKLLRLVGDTEVHFVTPEDMARLGGAQMLGAYHKAQGYIIARDGVSVGAEFDHVMLHEAVHAATQHAIVNNPVLRQQIKDIMHVVDRMAGNLPAVVNDHNPVTLPIHKHYALHGSGMDPAEFMAEALTNVEFQHWLQNITLGSKTIRELNLPFHRSMSAFQTIFRTLAKHFGFPENAYTAFEGIVHLSDQAMDAHIDRRFAEGRPVPEEEALSQMRDLTHDPASTARDIFEHPVTSAGNAIKNLCERAPYGSDIKAKALTILSNDQVRQMYEGDFGAKDESNPVRVFTGNIEKQNVRRREYEEVGDKIATATAQARDKYTPEEWSEYTALTRDATAARVDPSQPIDGPGNSHLRLGKGAKNDEDAAMGKWASRKAHAGLEARYDALPQGLKDLWQQSQAYYKETKTEEVRGSVRATLELAKDNLPPGSKMADLVERVMSGDLTEEEEAHFEKHSGIGKALAEARELRAPKGTYFPQRRRGEYVVTGEHVVTKPDNATIVTENGKEHYEFKTKKEAYDFVTGHVDDLGLPSKVRSAYYDTATGERSTKEGAISTEGEAEQRFHVWVDKDHMETKETRAEAEAARQDMIDAGLKNVTPVDKKRINPDVDYALSSPQIQELVRGFDKRADMSDADKAQIKRTLMEASIAMRSGTRVQARSLSRKNTKGASTDLVRAALEYSTSSAAYRSRQDFKPSIDAAMERMQKIADDYRHQKDGSSEGMLSRRMVVQEFEKRRYGYGSPENQGQRSPFFSKLMSASFMARMASPAHLLLHMTHPGMISMPVLGSRHGFGAAGRELYRAYRDMGGVMDPLATGAKSFGRMLKDPTASPTNFVGRMKAHLAEAPDGVSVGNMLDELTSSGYLHLDAGMETSKLREDGTTLGHGMAKVDTAFRELTTATESINRVAEATAAYRLEFRQQLKDNGGDVAKAHEAAVRYTKDTLANTQGLYSATNAAPIFRGGPLQRAVLQFRQFPQMIYHLLGRNLYQAFKGETPEVRREAARAFAGVVATHAAMAGALGLPLEVIKAPVMLANALGVTNTSWEDLEDKATKSVVGQLGPQLGEIVMHGLSRALGDFSPDVHHRLGLNSLLLGLPPESNKPADTMQWMLSTIAGSPGSMAQDTLIMSRAAMDGDFGKAAEHLPLKVVADLVKAYKLGTEGKPSKNGTGETPLSLPQIGVQAMGFKPAASANYDAAVHQSYREKGKIKDERSQALQGWLNATAGPDQAKAMQRISAFNQANPDDKLTSSALAAAKAKHQTYPKDTTVGQPENARTRRIIEDAKRTHNVGQ